MKWLLISLLVVAAAPIAPKACATPICSIDHAVLQSNGVKVVFIKDFDLPRSITHATAAQKVALNKPGAPVVLGPGQSLMLPDVHSGCVVKIADVRGTVELAVTIELSMPETQPQTFHSVIPVQGQNQ